MTVDRWAANREVWVREAADADLLAVINDVARSIPDGDDDEAMANRLWSVLWLASRGNEGRESGLAAQAAIRYGGFR